MPLVGGDCLDTIARLGDDAKIRLLVDDVGDAGAQQRVIVDQQDARGRSGASGDVSLHYAPALAARMVPRRARPRCRCGVR